MSFRAGPAWGHDFNVYTKRKRLEKLSYMHWNPVRRGLAKEPQEWAWSSFRHYLTGEEGVVEIESEWTGRKRERMGVLPRVKIVTPISLAITSENSHPSKRSLGGPPAEADRQRVAFL